MTEDEAIRHLARTTVLTAAAAKAALGYLANLRAPWEVKVDLVGELTTAAMHTGDTSRLWAALQLVKDKIGGAA